MVARHRSHRLTRPALLGVALLVALLPTCAFAHDGAGATIVASGVVREDPSVSIGPCGVAGLVAKLRNGRQREWYFVFAVNAGTEAEGNITAGGNATWSAFFRATRQPPRFGLGGRSPSEVRYTTSLPTTFAEANRAPLLRQRFIPLALLHPPGRAVFTHYYLLRVRQQGDAVAASITYAVGIWPPFFASICQVTIGGDFPR